jgi:translation initiation factor IF-3
MALKEVKFSINVDEHDYETKKNHVLRFIAEGDKVKASLRFKGREMAHRDLGRKVIERLIRETAETTQVEFAPRMEGNTMHAILIPRKDAGGKPKPPKPPSPKAAPPQSQAPSA